VPFTKSKFLPGDRGSVEKDFSGPAVPKERLIGSDEEFQDGRVASTLRGHSLFQDSFFSCNVKNVGDVHGTGCMYVETVVDRDTGCAFAKVFPSRNAMNSVDILSSRVLPDFKEMGLTVREIQTR
jgi:hypothetical protein